MPGETLSPPLGTLLSRAVARHDSGDGLIWVELTENEAEKVASLFVYRTANEFELPGELYAF